MENNKEFYLSSYQFKIKNPQEHSCAKCANRPINFCDSNVRINPDQSWRYKEGITKEQIDDAIYEDNIKGTTEHKDKLKEHRKCPTYRWIKAVPFYSNNCDCFIEEI